jgi:hypothetical protein
LSVLTFYGNGDHREFVLEVTALYLFGGEYPRVATPKARLLNCTILHLRKRYCNRLDELATEHKMHEKLNRLRPEADGLDRATFQARHNQWDYESTMQW